MKTNTTDQCERELMGHPSNYHFPSEKMLNSEIAKEMRAKRSEKDEKRKNKGKEAIKG